VRDGALYKVPLFRSLLLLAVAASAQVPASKWENLQQLAPRTQLRIATRASSKLIQGKLESVTESDVTLRLSAGPQTFPRVQIVSVSMRTNDRRLHKMLLGLGIGTAAGLLIGYGIGRAQQSNCTKSGGGWCGFYGAEGAVLGGASGLVGGSLAGAFWPINRWREVYP